MNDEDYEEDEDVDEFGLFDLGGADVLEKPIVEVVDGVSAFRNSEVDLLYFGDSHTLGFMVFRTSRSRRS